MERIEDKRRFFRIADVVDLTYRIITEREVTESSHRESHILSACALATVLESITHESAKLLPRIDKNQPELAHYLKLLDLKIDLLAQAVTRDKQTETENLCEIILSASGLAFHCNESIKKGAFLELKLVLASFRVLLVTCCKVVHCKQNHHSGNGRLPFLISADFIKMTEPDRELLIQYLVKRQMQQIRHKKGYNKPLP